MTLRLACVALSLSVMLSMTPARAATPVGQPPAWASLNKAQQAALAPLQGDWAALDAQRKQKWIEVADRFPHMQAAERQRVQARMAQWARMTPAERTRARLQFQESRELSPSERQAKWRAYQALPEDQRQRLAQRARPAARSGSAPAQAGRPASGAGTRAAAARTPAAGSRPVTPPIVVQAAPGATTTTLSARRPPHPHPSPDGRARIAATPGLVDPATLLPRHRPADAVSTPAKAPSAPVSR